MQDSNLSRNLQSRMAPAGAAGAGFPAKHPSFPAGYTSAAPQAPSESRNDPLPPPSHPYQSAHTSKYVAHPNFPYRPSSSFEPQTPNSSPTPSQSITSHPYVPMSWDWDGAVDYTGIAYEPQGELAREQQSEGFPGHDFNIPYPLDPSHYQSPQNIQASAASPGSQAYRSPVEAPLPPPLRRDMSQTGTKRKAESEPTSATSSVAPIFPGELQPPSKLSKSRTGSQSGSGARAQGDRPQVSRHYTQERAESPSDNGHLDEDTQPRKGTNIGAGKEKASSKGRRMAGVSDQLSGVLPSGKVFPIQVGSELFRLSGASLSSDAPSYFTHFFGEQLSGGPNRAGELKTLYIDRDPGVFRDIVLHLQGYHVRPRDAEHFVRLFADAQFYSLPRLTQQLFKSEIFVEIGGRDFRIPRDLFSSPGDSPNFFSLGFAHFFSTPSDVFPGLDRTTLLRPPSILPPAVHNRSGKIFAELMRLLQGYPVHIENEGHRAELLRDTRYFHLKGLEQRIIACEISYNLLRDTSEIVMKLEDLRQSGISFTPDSKSATANVNRPNPTLSPGLSGASPGPGFVSYSRPYVDEESHILILEINVPESTRLHFSAGPSPSSTFIRATFANQALARISSLFQVIANKMGLPATQPLGLMMLESGGGVAAQPVSPANSGVSGERVKIRIDADAYVEVDGRGVFIDQDGADPRSWASPRLQRPKARRRSRDDELDDVDDDDEEMEDILDFEDEEEITWIVKKAHWRLRVVPAEEPGRMEVVMIAVRVEAFTSERVRNKSRSFLS